MKPRPLPCSKSEAVVCGLSTELMYRCAFCELNDATDVFLGSNLPVRTDTLHASDQAFRVHFSFVEVPFHTYSLIASVIL